jgi:hypothetical protein
MTPQHLAFAAEARRLAYMKARMRKAAPYFARAGIACERGAGPGTPHNTFENLLRPHTGIACGRKAIQKPGINAAADFSQRLGYIAYYQRKTYPSAGKAPPIPAGYTTAPTRDEVVRIFPQLRPKRQRAAQFLLSEWIFFNAEKIQAASG